MEHLLFELSEGSDGIATLQAQASTRDAQGLAAARAEAQQVLDWAWARFPVGHGPVEDGQDWDHELLIGHEGDGWQVLTLTLSASPAFLDAFQARFGAALD